MNVPFLNKKSEVVTFRTAQDAFTYFLIKYQEQGIEIDKAVEKAFEVSGKYAERMGIPINVMPEKKGIEGALQNVKIVTNFINENPTVVEIGKQILAIGLSALGGAFGGAFLANKATQEIETPKVEPIVYDEDIQKTEEK